MVVPEWHKVPAHSDVAGVLAASFKSVRCAAKVWSKVKRSLPPIHPNCKFIIHLLDVLKEHHVLSLGKFKLRQCQECLDVVIRE